MIYLENLPLEDCKSNKIVAIRYSKFNKKAYRGCLTWTYEYYNYKNYCDDFVNVPISNNYSKYY